MKTRITYPQLWLDTDFSECSVDAQLLCMFLITNPYLGLSRYSRISDRQITFHTSISGKRLEKAKQELQSMKWFFFEGEWIYHNHSIAYVDYEGRDRVMESKNEEIDKVPEEIKEVFKGLITGLKPVLNHKSKTINQKQETEGECEGKPDEATPKSSKSSSKTASASDEATADSALKVLEKWNEVFETNFKSPRSIRSNLGYWLEVYELDQILEAIERIQYHKFWRDKMNPTTFLRRKNPRGEDVDYIGTMLNETKIPKKIEMSWDDEIPRNPEIPQDQVERNLERIKQMKRKLGALSV
jgi:hypothetical protein